MKETYAVAGVNIDVAAKAKELIANFHKLRREKYPNKFIESYHVDWLDVLTNYDKAKAEIKKGINEGAYLFMLSAGAREILRVVLKQCKKALDESYKELKE